MKPFLKAVASLVTALIAASRILRVVGVQFAVRREQVLAAIGDHEMVKVSDRIEPDGTNHNRIGIDVAHALRPQFLRTCWKKSRKASQVFGMSAGLYPALSSSDFQT